MIINVPFKTKTTQPGSGIYVNKPLNQENSALLTSILESLTKLNENLNKINYLYRKNKELVLNQKQTEEAGETK